MKKITRRSFLKVTALAAAAGTLAACGSASSTAASAAASSAAGSTAASGKTIKLGALYPLTGDLADSGTNMQYGIEYAINAINEKGINGAQVQIVYGDTQGKSDTAMTEMERLVTEENVDVVMGCYQSGVTATAAQVAEQYSVPLITANATSDALTAQGYQYFFRLAPTNMMFVRDMLAFVKAYSDKKSLGLSTIGIIADNGEVGQQTATWTEYYAKENGMSVVAKILYTQGAADLSSEVLQLKDAGADVVVADCYVSDAILLTKTMAEQTYTPGLMIAKGNGFSEASYLKSCGDLAEGISFATEFLPGNKGVDISDGFEAKYKVAMNGHSAEAYTTAKVLCEAFQDISDAGSEISPDTIQAELAKIDIEGKFADGTEIILPYDSIKFCEATEINGAPYLHTNLSGALTIAQFQGGKVVSVYPEDVAEADFEYPAKY